MTSARLDHVCARLLSEGQLHAGTAGAGLIVSLVSLGLAAVFFRRAKSGRTWGGHTKMRPMQRAFGMWFYGVGFGAAALVLAVFSIIGLAS